MRKDYTDSELIDILKRLAKELNRTPKQDDLKLRKVSQK